MKVVILGGGGRQAHGVALDLLKYDAEDLEELILADLSLARAEREAACWNDLRVKALQIDARDQKQLIELFRKCDVVVDSGPPWYETPEALLHAALAAGVSIITLHDHLDRTWGQNSVLALSEKFEKAGLTAIMGLGAAPGISSAMAKAIVDRLDGIDSLQVCFAHASLGPSSKPMTIPFLGALSEFTSCVVYKDHERQILPPRALPQLITFPDPVGARSCFAIEHGEVYTWPGSFKNKGLAEVVAMAGFAPDFYQQGVFLADIGLSGTDPIKVGDVEVIPMDVVEACYANLPPEQHEIKAAGVIRVVGRGVRGGDRLKITASMMSYPYHGLVGTVYRTATPAAIGARMLARGQIARKGVFPPECAVNPALMFEELSRRRLDVEITESTYL